MRSASVILLSLLLFGSWGATTRTVVMHGSQQTVRTFGTHGNRTAIVSSGDGGWIHLAPHVAELLAARGWFVVGFDTRGYLSSVTGATPPLGVAGIPRDYEALLAVAGAAPPPLLIGISEGAGLSVAAAADPALKHSLSGIVVIGLGDRNELAWRIRDSIIYFTKGVPREPLFRASDLLGRIAPLPLAIIRSTGDEFVAQEESDRLMRAASEPKRLWTVAAGDHRFSDNLDGFDARLTDAIAWTASANGAH